MLKPGQVITGTISYLDDAGNGILQSGRDRIYVRHVMAKEKVKVKIQKRLKEGYGATLLDVLEAHKERVQPICGIYERCGSCQMMHMSPKAQNQQKKDYLKRLSSKEQQLHLSVQDVIEMKEPYHYRNKMIIGFQKDKKGQLQAGFYEEFTHTIIPYQTCALHPTICDDIIQTIVRLMKKLRIEPYEEDKRRGLLRHVLIRYGMTSGQIMVVLVLNQPVFPARKAFVTELLKQHPMITTIIQNVNTRKTSIVLGDQERILYGPGYIEDTLCDKKFRISASSFYQINHEQCEVLYKKAIGLLNLKGNEVVLDAYCGIGTIGMYAAQFVKQVLGVELNKNAVEDAKNNAKLNGIRNIRFVCDDAGKFMQKMAAKREKLDVVIMDPPRSGSSEEFIRSVAAVRPKRVLYISCNPSTQMRDLKLFKKNGYVGSELYGVDMFPLTFHVESIVKLERLK